MGHLHPAGFGGHAPAPRHRVGRRQGRQRRRQRAPVRGRRPRVRAHRQAAVLGHDGRPDHRRDHAARAVPQPEARAAVGHLRAREDRAGRGRERADRATAGTDPRRAGRHRAGGGQRRQGRIGASQGAAGHRRPLDRDRRPEGRREGDRRRAAEGQGRRAGQAGAVRAGGCLGTGRYAGFGFGFRCPRLGPQGRSEAGSEGRGQARLNTAAPRQLKPAAAAHRARQRGSQSYGQVFYRPAGVRVGARADHRAGRDIVDHAVADRAVPEHRPADDLGHRHLSGCVGQDAGGFRHFGDRAGA
ncbi:hypothetical protein CBM2608_A10067 [Cupriavidus taiwanensis]|nr:hypothetical protein CBM2608_A10067 [Cupriavidus taiwanensis]